MTTQVIYPGTFDPVTYGHLDLIQRCQSMFEQVYIAVAQGGPKEPLFSVEKRIQLIADCLDSQDHVKIESFSGLLVDYAHSKNIPVIVRGIRTISDFEYEFQMALTNRKISKNVDTIFLMPDEAYSYVSSRMIKEICRLEGDISAFVPLNVVKALHNKIKGAKPRHE